MRTLGIPGHLFPETADRIVITAGHMSTVPSLPMHADLRETIRKLGIDHDGSAWRVGDVPVRLVVVDEFLFSGA